MWEGGFCLNRQTFSLRIYSEKQRWQQNSAQRGFYYTSSLILDIDFFEDTFLERGGMEILRLGLLLMLTVASTSSDSKCRGLSW